MIALNVEALGGTSIDEAIEEAQRLAEKLDVGIRFRFNGTPVLVSKDSDKKRSLQRLA